MDNLRPLPIKRRKQRYYIDVTFDRAVFMREGRVSLSMKLEELDLVNRPEWQKHLPHVEKVTVIEVKK